MPEAGGGQLGAGMEQAFGDHGEHEVALRARLGGENGIQAELAHGAQDRFDVAMGQTLAGEEPIVRRHQGLVAEEAVQGVPTSLGRAITQACFQLSSLHWLQ